jgi:hypothetical protein
MVSSYRSLMMRVLRPPSHRTCHEVTCHTIITRENTWTYEYSGQMHARARTHPEGRDVVRGHRAVAVLALQDLHR